MKGVIINQTKGETTIQIKEFSLGSALFGNRFQYFELHKQDILQMLKMVHNEPHKLYDLLNSLLIKIPPGE